MNILKNTSGAAALEYALVVALMSASTVIAMHGLGHDLNAVYRMIATALQNAR